MKGLVRFLASTAGRLTRIAAGLVLIAWGAFNSGGVKWLPIIIGLIPLLAGVFDICLIAAMFGYPLSGKKIRELVNS